MSETSTLHDLAAMALLPGIALRHAATVTMLAFWGTDEDVPPGGVESVLRTPWALRLRSVVRWRDLDADWPLAALTRATIPLPILGVVYPWHWRLTYPLSNPDAVPLWAWIPIAYVLANLAYALLADIAATYLDVYQATRNRAEWTS